MLERMWKQVKLRGMAILVVVMLALTGIVGCGQQGSDSEAPDVPAYKELRIGHSLDPATLNPVETTAAANQSIYAQIIEELVIFAAQNNEIQPWLVTEWEWLDDVTLEMKLRQDVEFTNGEPFDAESAKFSIDRFAESSFYRLYLPENIYKETEIVDTHTVRVHLHRPYAAFMAFLARGGSALPPKYYEEVGAEGFGRNPIGTGPFVLDDWVKDSHITLVRNEGYWNGPHLVDKVTFKVIAEETARVAALETGEIDIALMVPMSAVERLNANPDTVAVTSPGARKFAAHFDTKYTDNPALKDPRVRIALNMAVDKEAICEAVFGGTATPLEGQWMLAHDKVGFNPEIKMFPYDPEGAKRLLAEAGYPDGFDLTLAYTVGRYAQDKELGEVVSSYLEQIGIRVNQEALEYGSFSKAWREKTIGTHQWGLATAPDPCIDYHTFGYGSSCEYNDMGTEYNDMLNELSYTMNPADQRKICQELAKMMHEDPPCIYLVVPMDVYGINKRVENFEPRLSQVLWLYDVDIAAQ